MKQINKNTRRAKIYKRYLIVSIIIGSIMVFVTGKEYIEKNYPDAEVFLFDCMKYINGVIDKVCGSTYSKITTNIPWFWGKIYYNTQEPIFERIMDLSNKVLSYKLGRLLKDLKPDLIISTHFFVGHMCTILKKNGALLHCP